ncbi:lipoprotein LpqH [Corynebacterium sp. USCH3]|uniref:lipoprotein LpqH n=1 Tax=Corynebacterium sp. USCH3 TaxID=3024840 RepID=UPI0030A77601
MNITTIRRRTAVAAVGIVAAGALVACSDGDGGDTATDTAAQETVTETVTAEPSTSTESSTADTTTSSAPTSGSSAGGDGSVATLMFDGEDVASQFTEVQCREDGADEYEIDLWNEERTDHVEIDLDVRDAPRVDGLGVDRGGKEWESTDAQERDATVEVDGDTYRVNGQLEVDDDHPDAGDVADLEVEVSCA